MNVKITGGIIAAILTICAIAFGTSRMAPEGSSSTPSPTPRPVPSPTLQGPPTRYIPADRLSPEQRAALLGTSRIRLPAQSPSQTPSQPAPRPPAQPPQQSCTAPSIKFKSWTVGRSSGTESTFPRSFITTTETTCKVKFEVTYDGSHDPSTTCEITSASWTVTMSHGFTVSGDPTEAPSGSGFSKVWTYEATLKGNSSLKNTGTKCDDDEKGPNLKPDFPGRNKKPMKLEVRFVGTVDSTRTSGVSITLTQDEIDGIRQEYVDYNRQIVPARGKFTRNSNSDFNWGHYEHLIDQGLDARREAWAKWTNSNFTKESFYATSGFRHPYHNSRCVPGVQNSSHQYGNAIDVRGRKHYDEDSGAWLNPHMDFTGSNGTPDGKIDKYERNAMKQAAVNAGSFYEKIYRTGHVHADWRPTDWNRYGPNAGVTTLGPARSYNSAPSPSDDDDSGDSGGTGDTAPAAPSVSPPPPPPPPVLCGNSWRGSGACTSNRRTSSRTAHQSTCGAGHTYWGCNRTAVAWHATSYTCTRSGCGQTYTKCSKGNGSCRARRPGGGTYQWHD